MGHLPSPDPLLAQDSTVVSYGGFTEQVVKETLSYEGETSCFYFCARSVTNARASCSCHVRAYRVYVSKVARPVNIKTMTKIMVNVCRNS